MKTFLATLFSLLCFYCCRSQHFLAAPYPSDYHGTVLYSGERYSKFIATAASNLVSEGSKVLISDVETQRSVLVKINDKIEEASVDFLLSDAVYNELGIQRKEKILVQYQLIEGEEISNAIASLDNQPKDAVFRTKGTTDIPAREEVELKPNYYTLQLGAFSERSSALALIETLKKETNAPEVFIRSAHSSETKTLYRVLCGQFDNQDKAREIQQSMQQLGYLAIVKPIRDIM